MVKPKLQLRRKSTAVNNDNSQLSSRSSRGTKQLCKLYCFSFSPIIYGNAIADKMGVSTAFVLKSGCTQREGRGGKVEETNQGNNPRQQRQFTIKRKTSFQH